MKQPSVCIFTALWAVFFASSTWSFSAERKMSEEDLLARHLDSLGTQDARSARTSLAAKGEALFRILVGGTGQLPGQALFQSEGEKLSLLILFGFGEYHSEKFVYDGKDVETAFMTPGTKSPAGEFLFSYKEILKEGLLGGVLSPGWALSALEEKKAKIKNKGIEKIDETELFEVEYRMRKSVRGLDIALFFDPETLQHVRSEYKVRVSSGMGPFPGVPSAGSTGQAMGRDTRLKLEEIFGGFKQVDGLTVPTQWTLRSTTETNQGTTLWEWQLNFNEFQSNGPLSEDAFSVQ